MSKTVTCCFGHGSSTMIIMTPIVFIEWGTRGFREFRAWTKCEWTNDRRYFGAFFDGTFFAAIVTTAMVRNRRVLGWCRVRCTAIVLIPQAGAMGRIIVRQVEAPP